MPPNATFTSHRCARRRHAARAGIGGRGITRPRHLRVPRRGGPIGRQRRVRRDPQPLGRADLAIGGYRLQGCASGTGNASDRVTVPAGVTLEPGQAYLFVNDGTSGYSGAVAGDQTYSTGFTDFAASNQSGIRVLDAAGAIADQVGSPTSPCREGTGITTPTTEQRPVLRARRARRRTPTTTRRTSPGRTPSDPQNLETDRRPSRRRRARGRLHRPAGRRGRRGRDAHARGHLLRARHRAGRRLRAHLRRHGRRARASRASTADTYSLDPQATLPERRELHARRRGRPLPRRRHGRPAGHRQRPHDPLHDRRRHGPADPRHPGRRRTSRPTRTRSSPGSPAS